MSYWAEYPPVHVSIAGLLRALAGSGDTAAPGAPSNAPRLATPDEAQAFVDYFKNVSGHG